MTDILPLEFNSLVGKISFIRMKTENEYSASCPQCKGEIHEDGACPDRFILWRSSRRGTPFGLCRKCGYKWSPEKSDADWTVEEREEFRLKIVQLEREYFEKKSRELEELSRTIEEQGFYKRYYEDGLDNAVTNKYYESRGIPPMWREYLQKGYIRDYKVRGSLSTYNDSAFTSPIWTLGNKIQNVKLRVAHPVNSNDRYRNLYKSGCQHLYVPMHENEKLSNKVVVMEGEYKADVGEIWGELSSEFQVIGVQSSMPEKRILKMLADSDAEVFYLAFDPDAYMKNSNGVTAVLNTAKQIGEKRCRLVIPPRNTKLDDGILAGLRFSNLINMAVKTI